MGTAAVPRSRFPTCKPIQPAPPSPPLDPADPPRLPPSPQVHKSGDTKQRKQSLGLASRMVANSRRAAERLAAAEAAAAPAAGHGAADAGNNAAGAAAGGGRGTLADAFTALQEFGIAARRNDAEGLMAALGRAAALGCVGGEQLAAHGGGGGGPRVQVGAAKAS